MVVAIPADLRHQIHFTHTRTYIKMTGRLMARRCGYKRAGNVTVITQTHKLPACVSCPDSVCLRVCFCVCVCCSALPTRCHRTAFSVRSASHLPRQITASVRICASAYVRVCVCVCVFCHSVYHSAFNEQQHAVPSRLTQWHQLPLLLYLSSVPPSRTFSHCWSNSASGQRASLATLNDFNVTCSYVR